MGVVNIHIRIHKKLLLLRVYQISAGDLGSEGMVVLCMGIRTHDQIGNAGCFIVFRCICSRFHVTQILVLHGLV